MSLADMLSAGVRAILRASWDVRDGRTVPTTESVTLEGGGVRFEGTVLYADLAQSSQLATDFQQRTAAKILKSFLFCCTRLITAHQGSIVSFDGDRVMGIFAGDKKNSNAATVALKINYAVTNIIRPKMDEFFVSMKESSFSIQHAVGVDLSSILAVRAGQRGSNDLIWIGRAPNLAAALSEIRGDDYASYITEAVYNKLNGSAKYKTDTTEDMWDLCTFPWIDVNWNVYRSAWTWKP